MPPGHSDPSRACTRASVHASPDASAPSSHPKDPRAAGGDEQGRAPHYTRSLFHLSPFIDSADQARLYWVVDREAMQHRGLLWMPWWAEWRGVEQVTVDSSTPLDVGVDDFRHVAPAIHTAALKTPRLSRVRPGAGVGM